MQTKKMLAWKATPEELRKVELLKTALGRQRTSDLFRFLVTQALQKILPADMQ